MLGVPLKPAAEKLELTPASKNIWYALATVAGEPEDLGDEEVIERNRNERRIKAV